MVSYVWRGRFDPCAPHEGPFDAADSWRHSSGRAHGLDLHLKRFSRSAGPLPAGFVGGMLALLGEGELFPRIARKGAFFLLDVRPAPPPRPTSALTLAAGDDPRTQPLVKGPDFARLAAYRDRYQRESTDDVVICGPGGAMLETTTGALVAWDGDTLVVPKGVWLPSVTSHQVVARAEALDQPVERRSLTPEFVAERPLWFLNSLHGVSPVTELRTETGIIRPPAHPDAAEWQAWWWAGFR